MKNSTAIKSTIFSLVVGLSVAPGNSDAAIFNESSIGDFDNDLANPFLLAPDVRTVTGVSEMDQSQNSTDTDGGDLFTFTDLQAGIVTIDVEASAVSDRMVGDPDGTIDINITPDSSFASLGDFITNRIGVGGTGTNFGYLSTFTITSSFFPGGDLSVLLDSSEIGASNYSLSVSVTAIPLPGAGLLLGTGLALVAGNSRPKKRARIRK